MVNKHIPFHLFPNFHIAVLRTICICSCIAINLINCPGKVRSCHFCRIWKVVSGVREWVVSSDAVGICSRTAMPTEEAARATAFAGMPSRGCEFVGMFGMKSGNVVASSFLFRALILHSE